MGRIAITRDLARTALRTEAARLAGFAVDADADGIDWRC